MASPEVEHLSSISDAQLALNKSFNDKNVIDETFFLRNCNMHFPATQ